MTYSTKQITRNMFYAQWNLWHTRDVRVITYGFKKYPWGGEELPLGNVKLQKHRDVFSVHTVNNPSDFTSVSFAFEVMYHF